MIEFYNKNIGDFLREAKEISQLDEIEINDNTKTVIYNESEGTGQTALSNLRRAIGVQSVSATITELPPHSEPSTTVDRENSNFTINLKLPKTNGIKESSITESVDENGLRSQNVEIKNEDETKTTFTIKDGVGISSIETTETTASKGLNKVVINTTNGESKHLSIRNGKDFTITHRFSSVEEMESSNGQYVDENGETVNFEINDFVMIDSDVEKEENSRLYYYLGEGIWKFSGDISGCKGDSGTIEIGTVETIEAGENVEIENVGTPQSAILNFKLPKGDKGDRATIQIGNVESVDNIGDIEIENTGNEYDAVLNFKFPKSLGGDSVVEVDTIPQQSQNKIYNIRNENRVFSKDIELTTKEQLDSRNHSPLLKLDSTETWNRSRLSTSFQLGGGSSTTKGTSQTIYIDTGSSGKWYQRNEEWCVQINAGTKFYIPYLGDGTITILYYNQGSVVFTGTKENITQINNGKYFEFSCDTNDYIKSITYNYKKEVYALQTDNNGNVNVYERLNAKTVSATEDVKVQGFSLWDYIKNKISSILGLTSSQYNGNAKTATSATKSASSTFAIGNYSVIGEGKPTTDFTAGSNVSNIFPTNGVFVANKDGETSGIHLNGNNIVMWTPCDDDAIRIYDEDDFGDNDLHPLARLDDNGNWWNKSDDRLVNTADLDDLESILDERIENVQDNISDYRDNINSLNDDVSELNSNISELNKIPTWEYLTSYGYLKLYINRKLRLIKGVGTLSDTNDSDGNTVESSFYINVQTSTGYKTAIPLSVVSGYYAGRCRAEYYNSNQIKITYYSSESCTIGMFSY